MHAFFSQSFSIFVFLSLLSHSHAHLSPFFFSILFLQRQGDFYEAYGHDAVMLVEHAGLNPMGSGPVAKAGCPVSNLRPMLRDLTDAGFSVLQNPTGI